MSKHVPIRKCVGCGGSFPKKELIRFTRKSSGEITLDLHGKMPGRGFYLCPQDRCLDAARKAKAFEKVFSLRLDDSLILEFKRQIKIRQEVSPWGSE